MKNQSIHLGAYLVLIGIYANQLPRSETDDRTLLIIIIPSAIFQRTIRSVFQEQGIYAIIHLHVIDNSGRFPQIHDRDQRMQGFQTIHLIINIDTVQLNNFVHIFLEN